MKKAPKINKYKDGGPIKLDMTKWSPELVAQAQKANNEYLANKANGNILSGTNHSMGGQATVGLIPGTTTKYKSYADDPQYSYVSGDVGQRIYQTNKKVPYGPNDVVDPRFPEGKPLTYVENKNKNGELELLQVPTATYQPTKQTSVVDPTKANTIAPAVYNAGTYQQDQKNAAITPPIQQQAQPASFLTGNTAPPNIKNYKQGGIVKRIKGYSLGGDIAKMDFANTLTDQQKAGVGAGSQLANMGGQYLNSQAINSNGTVDANQAALAGALQGGAKGAQMGMMFGPEGAAIGAGAGALIGAGTKYFGAKNLNENIAYGKDMAQAQKQRDAQNQNFQNSLQKQMQERQEGYKNGGQVKYGNGGDVNSGNTGVGKYKKIYTKSELEAIQKKDAIQKQKNSEFEKNMKMGNTVIAVPSNKGYDYPDSTYYYPNSKTGIGIPYITTTLGARLLGVTGDNIQEALKYSDVPYNIRQDSREYRVNGFKHGGEIKGKGTAKSDSILAKVRPGSFIVPAENREVAEEVKEKLLGKPDNKAEERKEMKAPKKKEADLNQKGGEKVKLSNGEFLFTPEEKAEIVQELGEDFLHHLAPNAEHEKEEFREGGLTAAKAKIMLHEGVANGKPLTDKQRGYFGLIASGYKCGGMVKGYKEGGDIDGSDDEIKKEKERLEKERLANEKEGKYYKDIQDKTKAGLKKLEERKKIESEFKDNLERIKARRKEYADFLEKSKKEPLYSQTHQGLASTDSPQEKLQRKEKIRQQQEEMLGNLEKYEKEHQKMAAKYLAAKDDKNFNPDGSFKEDVKSAVVKSTTPSQEKTSSVSGQNIPSKSGADLEKALGSGNTTTSKVGITKAPSGIKFNAPSMEGEDVTIPINGVANNVAPTYAQQSNKSNGLLADTYNKSLPSTNAQSGKNNNYLDAAQGIASQIGGIGNYFLPFQQYKMGQKYLAQSGARPKGQIDPDFLRSVTTAQANAKFGYTPEEQAALNMQNVNALRAGQNAAKNYSGGDASAAYNMTRDAANEYYGRGLQAKLASKNLQFQKQQYADQLNASKADMNRQLFQDNLNAWQQNQTAGGNLIGAGIQNLIGANRLNQELAFQQKYAQGNNPYAQYSTNPLGQ